MDEICEVEIQQVTFNPYQPRKKIAPEELAELASSIREVGLIHPPLVRRIENKPDSFELISGERRLRAASFAGLTKIPVVVKNESTSDAVSAQAALIENIQRVDLNAIEVALSLQRLLDEFGFNQEELANRIGKSRSSVANYLRLLSLPESIQEGVADGSISFGHAKVILGAGTRDDQAVLHDKIMKEGLSVRDAEKACESKRKLKRRVIEDDCHMEELRKKLQHKFGTKVIVKNSGGRGEISIQYFNLDDLDRILELLEIEIN